MTLSSDTPCDPLKKHEYLTAKAVFLYKCGLENSVVHQKVITLQLKAAFKVISIEGNIKYILQSDL